MTKKKTLNEYRRKKSGKQQKRENPKKAINNNAWYRANCVNSEYIEGDTDLQVLIQQGKITENDSES